MGDVIQMFKAEPEPTEPFVVDDILDDDFSESIVEVMSDLNDLWLATSERDFIDRLRSIKDRMRDWPGG